MSSYAAAAQIARDAGAPLVAGDIGPTGSLLAPLGELSFEEAYDIFAEQARAACAAGCDLIFLETFADLLEAKAALLACLDNTPLPVFVTMTFGEDGRTFMGTTPAVAAATLSALGASAVGINCSLGPGEITPLVAQMAPHTRCPLMVQPNAGLPRIAEDSSTVYDVDPARFAQAMGAILEAGARIVGGCCGTTPAHIAALRQLIDDGNWLHDNVSDYRPSFVVTSAQELVELMPGAPTVATIGERINPTGKPRLKEALASGSYDLAISEAVAQIEAGADILDVNVGVPGIDESHALRELTERLQATVSAPLQLDSANPHALEAACRSYAGRPLINSVNGARLKASPPCCPLQHAMARPSLASRSTKTAFHRLPRGASALPSASSTLLFRLVCSLRTSQSIASSWPPPPISPKSPRSSKPFDSARSASACAPCSASPT